MAPPACARCGSLDLAFLGEDLRRAWAAEEGVQWNWKGNLAYWRQVSQPSQPASQQGGQQARQVSQPASPLADQPAGRPAGWLAGQLAGPRVVLN